MHSHLPGLRTLLLLLGCLLLPAPLQGQSLAPPVRIGIFFAMQDFPTQGLASLRYPTSDSLRLVDALAPRFTDFYLLADPAAIDKTLAQCSPLPGEPALCRRLQAVVQRFQHGERYHLLPPSKTALLKLLEALKDRTDERSEVLVYLSTHGQLLTQRTLRMNPNQVAFATRELKVATENGRWLNPLTEAEVLEGMDALQVRQAALIEATCHREPVVRGGTIERSAWATVVISDSSPGESSLEDPSLGAGVFTHFFLEAVNALHNKATELAVDIRSDDGAITLEEAYIYAARQTLAYTGRRGPEYTQHATRFDLRTLEPAPFVLAGQELPADDAVSFLSDMDVGRYEPSAQLGQRGVRVEVDDRDVPLEDGRKTLLKPGLRHIVLTQPEGRKSFLLKLEPGSQLTLGRLTRLQQQALQLRLSVGGATWLEPDSPWAGLSGNVTVLKPLLSPPRERWRLQALATFRLATDAGCRDNMRADACAEGSLGSRETASWLARLGVGVELERRLIQYPALYGQVGLSTGPMYFTLFRLDPTLNPTTGITEPGYVSTGMAMLTGLSLGLELRRPLFTLGLEASAQAGLFPLEVDEARLHLLGQVAMSHRWRF